jgi:hypothetical protein
VYRERIRHGVREAVLEAMLATYAAQVVLVYRTARSRDRREAHGRERQAEAM